jgi:hypothetical protein
MTRLALVSDESPVSDAELRIVRRNHTGLVHLLRSPPQMRDAILECETAPRLAARNQCADVFT